LTGKAKRNRNESIRISNYLKTLPKIMNFLKNSNDLAENVAAQLKHMFVHKNSFLFKIGKL